jgi:hypothetical protein
MPASLPTPCKLQRGSGGAFYYFDGVNPPTLMLGGVGTDLNAIDGALTVHTVTAAQFDNIQDHFVARLRAFAAIADCETCPTEMGTFDEHFETYAP